MNEIVNFVVWLGIGSIIGWCLAPWIVKRTCLGLWDKSHQGIELPPKAKMELSVLVAGGSHVRDDGVNSSWFNGQLWDLIRHDYIIKEIVLTGDIGAERLGRKWAAANNVPVRYFYKRSSETQRQFLIKVATYADRMILMWDGYNKTDAAMRDVWFRHRGLPSMSELTVVKPPRAVKLRRTRAAAPLAQNQPRRTIIKADNK